MAANRVHWDTWSTLAAALSRFSELGTELELLGSGRNADLTEDQVDALWTQALGLRLASIVRPSIGCSWLSQWRGRGVMVVDLSWPINQT
jgi:hypothetical protein